MNDTRAKALEAARSLEKRGETNGAVASYLRIGAFAEAANALIAANRLADAGHLLLDGLAVGLQLLGGLDAEKKKLAQLAADCFSRAGDARKASDIFLGLGDASRAADVLENAGDTSGAARIRATAAAKGQVVTRGPVSAQAQASAQVPTRADAERLEASGHLAAALEIFTKLRLLTDAARCAFNLGRFSDAAKHFDDAGMPYESAVCFLKGGAPAKALEVLVRLSADHPRYRASAMQAIKLADELKSVDFRLDQFLVKFIADGPQSDPEAEALYTLATLYRGRGFLENARELYQKLLSTRGSYRDAAAHLADLEAEDRKSKMSFEDIVKADLAFRANSAPSATVMGVGVSKGADRAAADAYAFPDLPPLPATAAAAGAIAGSHGGIASAATVPLAAAAPPGPSAGPAATASAASAFDRNGELIAGSVVAGRYRVDRTLGRGGMAIVYQVFDSELSEAVAMKVFSLRSDPSLLSRFKQEVSLSRKLAHPNIVRLYDIGEHEGYKFLTMELLDGRDLATLLAGKPMEARRTIRYLMQACQGLAMAHEAGMVHRDIKPDNFFVTSKDDMLKVMDFGIAKGAATKDGSKLTVAGFVAGTPAYMSPEQINDFASVDQRSDLYAIGVVAFEMLTGRVPFEAPDTMPLLLKHLQEAPPSPRSLQPSISPKLEALILRLLEKDPKNRVQSCRELGTLLWSVGDG